jgi:hypothetical protein
MSVYCFLGRWHEHAQRPRSWSGILGERRAESQHGTILQNARIEIPGRNMSLFCEGQASPSWEIRLAELCSMPNQTTFVASAMQIKITILVGGSILPRAGSTVVEVKGSHAIYVSQPEAVAALVEKAAKSVKTSAAA